MSDVVDDMDVEMSDVYEDERWVPVVIKHKGKVFEDYVRKTHEVSNFSRIRNTETGAISKGKDERLLFSGPIVLGGEHVKYMLMKHRVCLASFYPDEIPDDIDNFHCDHIDGSKNSHLSNLQWLSAGDHAVKTRKQTRETCKSKVEKQGKLVEVIAVRGGGDKSKLGETYPCARLAAEALGVKTNDVGQSARRGNFAKKMYKFAFVTQQLLPGEKFRPIGDRGHEVSNKGRFKNRHGKITVGADTGKGPYRSVYIKLRKSDEKKSHYSIHRLVYEAFGDVPLTADIVVMHNDTYNTRGEDGFERNWFVDLSVGTQRENSQSYQDNRTDLRKVRCIKTGKVYHSAAAAGKALGINGHNISRACREPKRKVGGLHFEFVVDVDDDASPESTPGKRIREDDVLGATMVKRVKN